MSNLTTETYTISRHTLFIPKPYAQVLAKLQRSIKKDTNSTPLSLTTHKDKTSFTNEVNPLLGPHSFMQFHLLNHGAWLALHDPSEVPHAGKQAMRVIYGNPLIAITMLKEDVRGGLHVPVDALVVQRLDGKGTDVVWVRPSSVIAGWEGASMELRRAAEVLDGKVEALWGWVAGDEDEGEGKL
ncbi:hypothetical protein M409DRAFT_19448 [Zasmidium cellare ATCC 36951]|uniref:DUF302 domain-containing protein n=1 Tax=Zasmidium cellare ATCC 36951 TaxID=1080233 RepID=A0A6A6CV92_ZASCE|nr:uncharacterized protein M409DRAFT_19448 [Zasmidium cellare ATCC 36951]KAF2170633.1 hypothetical protein M409DRAFT_19448 [Zasmidium cellare ATCC 36951]